MNTEILMLSPEKAVISYRLASLGSRIFAHLVDLLVDGALTLAIMYVMLALAAAGPVGQQLAGLAQPVSIGFFFLYFILLEGLWNGQTPGKKAMGIRVRMSDGTPITFQAALGRNLIRPADMLPNFYFVGFAAIFTTPRAQRFGDLVSGTVVTHEKRGLPIFHPAPHRLAGEHPYEQYVGDLRGMTLEEYRALRRFCDRYPELSTAIQSRMLNEVWRPIALRRGVPELPGVHPLLLAEATVMKYGRMNGLL
ncbi:MAG TPA: RDD family protein [Fimbriimonadaceae bacterium]|nr:RDD family protein [Fimbriimonadaceae bacterium]